VVLGVLYFLGKQNPAVMLAFLATGVLYTLTVHIIVVVAAFRESAGTGFLTLCIPFYALYFVYKVSENDTLKVLYTSAVLLNIGLRFLPVPIEWSPVAIERAPAIFGGNGPAIPVLARQALLCCRMAGAFPCFDLAPSWIRDFGLLVSGRHWDSLPGLRFDQELGLRASRLVVGELALPPTRVGSAPVVPAYRHGQHLASILPPIHW
jgi:hypothetical protein